MKIALFSDMHSNVFALEAAIGHAKQEGCDRMVNLGDILYGPIAPKATYDLLMREKMITICGNQDRQIFDATPGEISANPTLQFILADLGPEPIEWMRSLPFDHQLTDDIYLCHGSPTSDLVYLLEDVTRGFPRLRSDAEIISLLGGKAASIIVCGHTHIPRAVALSSGQLVINPGSVGLPAYQDDQPVHHAMETYSPLASYAILERAGNKWHVGQFKVSYDTEKAVAQARKNGREDWAHYLATGRKTLEN